MPIRIGWRCGSKIRERAQAKVKAKVKERSSFFLTLIFAQSRPVAILSKEETYDNME
jgi:hypothetical protein